MLRRFLIISVFVLVGSLSAFAQNGTANCPKDQKQVTREVTTEGKAGFDRIFEFGGSVKETVREVSCEPKEKTQRESGSTGKGRSGGGGGFGKSKGW